MEGYTSYQQENLETKVDEMYDRLDDLSYEILNGIVKKIRGEAEPDIYSEGYRMYLGV